MATEGIREEADLPQSLGGRAVPGAALLWEDALVGGNSISKGTGGRGHSNSSEAVSFFSLRPVSGLLSGVLTSDFSPAA